MLAASGRRSFFCHITRREISPSKRMRGFVGDLRMPERTRLDRRANRLTGRLGGGGLGVALEMA